MNLDEQHLSYHLSRPAGVLQPCVLQLLVSLLIIAIQADQIYIFIN